MIENKIIIITGGTGHLGKVLVTKLADLNTKLYLPVRSIEKFKNIFDSSIESKEFNKIRNIFAFECDVTNEVDVIDFVGKVSKLENNKIDCLINIAGGIHPPKNIEDISNNLFLEYWNLNFLSAFMFSREVLKFMKSNKYGIIFSISSIAAIQNTKGIFAYASAKHSLIKLMESITFENIENNIRCYTIIPSIIDTESNREWGTPEDIKKWVKPEEIADIIIDLIDDKYMPVRDSIIKIFGKY